MKIRNIFATVSIVCSLAAISTATVARAERPVDIDQVSSVRVSHADLDLSEDRGRKTLDSRIRQAIRKVCGVIEAHDLARNAGVIECHRQASRDSAAPLAAIVDPIANRRLAIQSARASTVAAR